MRQLVRDYLLIIRYVISRESGDTILSISGIFSGTLSWLFLQFDGSVPFSDLVEQSMATRANRA